MSNNGLSTVSAVSVASGLPDRLETIRVLSNLAQDVLSEFERFIRTAPDELLFRTSPMQFAAHTGVSERESIDLFLYAAHAGIFEIQWGVLCPSCAAFVQSPGGLRTINDAVTCTMCMSSSPVEVDDQVEVAFTIQPNIRRIRFHSLDSLDLRRDWQRLFYSTNRIVPPAISTLIEEHVVIDVLRLAPDAALALDLTLDAGEYQVTAPRFHANVVIVADPTATPSSAVHIDLYDGRGVPRQVVVAPGRLTLHIHNRIGQEVAFGVIRSPRTMPQLAPFAGVQMPHFYTLAPFLTAKRLATSQVFRDLFRAESIPSELGLAFKSVTFLFSDLKGSTALYERIGDIRAYQLVREHFTLLRDIIAEVGGAVVKTMGDAVMASFHDPLPALEAAVLMNREIGRLGVDEGLILKVGVHVGSCIAVENNDRLDYFGQTVNIAARVQGVAGAGDIIVTEPVYTTAGAPEIVRSAGLRAAQERGMLRGIERETVYYRLQ